MIIVVTSNIIKFGVIFFMFNIYDKYVEIAYGYNIEDIELINKITATIGHYKDCKLDDKTILSLLLENGPKIINFENSLTNHDIFYFHNQLRINSKSPIWHPEKGTITFPYYLEMKSLYTLDDLLDYYYKTILIPIELRDRKRDTGAFSHMLNKYKFDKLNTLDIILTAIDLSKENKTKIVTPFDIETNISEAYEVLTSLLENNKQTIIWRDK